MKKKTDNNSNSYNRLLELKKDRIGSGGQNRECTAEILLSVDNSEEKTGEVAMWRAVITQALMDAGSKSNKKEMKYERAQAIAWLAGTTEDFHIVCSLADMDPIYVRERAKEAIKRGCVWREESRRQRIARFKKQKKSKKLEKQSKVVKFNEEVA